MRVQSVPPGALPDSFCAATHRAFRFRSRVAVYGPAPWTEVDGNSGALVAFAGHQNQHDARQYSNVRGRVYHSLELAVGAVPQGEIGRSLYNIKDLTAAGAEANPYLWRLLKQYQILPALAFPSTCCP